MKTTQFTVIGGAGFIGRNLVAHLSALGHTCFVPLRDDPQVFARPLGHVIYAAGLTSDFRSRPLDTVESHVCLLRRIIASADFTSLTYLSSTRVYAGSSDTSEAARLMVDPHDPGDLYNLSKLMGESLCLHGGPSDMKVARLSNIVGLRPDADSFIDQLLEEGFTALGRVLLKTALASRKDYLYVDDAVALIVAIAVSPARGIFNVASGEGVSNGEIAELLHRDLKFDIQVAPDAPTWKFEKIDNRRVREVFGFAPRKFSEYFPDYLNLYRQNKGTL